MKNRSIGVYIYCLMLLIGAGVLCKHVIFDILLSYNYKVSTARIIDFGVYSGRTSSASDFVFTLDGTEYEGHFGSQENCQHLNDYEKAEIMTYEVPIVYHPENPNNCEILLKKKQYKKFNVPYPDGEVGAMLDKYFNCD